LIYLIFSYQFRVLKFEIKEELERELRENAIVNLHKELDKKKLEALVNYEKLINLI